MGDLVRSYCKSSLFSYDSSSKLNLKDTDLLLLSKDADPSSSCSFKKELEPLKEYSTELKYELLLYLPLMV